MTNTTFPTVAAARPRTLSTPPSPFAVPMAGDSWLHNHNSIAATMRPVVGTSAVQQRADYGAAKQAAPPRGELR